MINRLYHSCSCIIESIKLVGKLSLGLFSIFLYTFTMNCVTTGAQKCLLGICFALFVANNV